MDHSLTGDQPAPNPFSQAVGFGYTKGPTGEYFVTVTHQVGLTSFTYGIPLDSAPQVADEYAANIRNVAAEARRERSGIVVAAPQHVNGSRHQRRAT